MYSRIGFLLIGAALLLSVFLPVTRGLWDQLDLAVFQSINPLLENETFGTLVSLLNSRLGDWMSHLAFAALLLVGIASRKEAFFSLILLVAVVAMTQIGVNKGFFMKGLHFERMSPSLRTESFVNVEKTHPFPNNRATSKHSFPADHATTGLLSASWIALASQRKGSWKVPFILAFFFALPPPIYWGTWPFRCSCRSSCHHPSSYPTR